MTVDKAKLLLRVESVKDSISFYVNKLGWTLIKKDEAENTALMSIIPNYPVVLSTGHTHFEWMDDIAHKPSPGDCFYVGVTSVEAIGQQLLQQGVTDYQMVEDPGSIRKLLVPTPDGYTAIYWEELYPTTEEIIRLYKDGADHLREALQGLDDQQLDLARAPGKWTIRQHTLHLIDLELVTIHKVKFALAESGKEFTGTPFSQEDWSRGLDYAHRSIETEVEMFALLRKHIMGMCSSLQNALERHVHSSGKIETVEQLLKKMAGHVNHHIRTIREIRSFHSIRSSNIN